VPRLCELFKNKLRGRLSIPTLNTAASLPVTLAALWPAAMLR
jgi:hypothetical protein